MLHRIIELAQAAGKAIIEIYSDSSKWNCEYKDDKSPLTAADEISNEIIVTALHNKYPDYAVLSEEEQDDIARLSNDYCFIVDPLDGTKEFLKCNNQFTVNIALAYKHKPILGVIYAPALCELYYAEKGKGAYSVINGVTTELHVTDTTNISKLRAVASNSHGCSEMDDLLNRHNITNVVNIGSSLKGCMVASGQADIYYRFNPTMEWDTAAMQCIVEEAGGIFRQMDDSEMLYNRGDCRNSKGFYVINRSENRLY